MYINELKNFIIVFLIFLSTYQTTKLWFGNFSTHSFFDLDRDIAIAYDDNIQKDTKYLTKSILINTGDNKFIRKYNNISNSDYKKTFDKAIYLAMKKGKISYVDEFDIKQILDKKVVIYNYDFNIKNEDIPNLFNQKGNNVYKIKDFDTIIIIPSTNNTQEIETIFLSSETLEACSIKNHKESLFQDIIYFINEFKNIEYKDFYYISSEEIGISLFNKNQFLLKEKEDIPKIKLVNSINPLEQDGGILLSESEKYVNVFFDSPLVKNTSFINSIYTYNDDNIIVKYYPNSVLEYIRYKQVINANREESPYNIALQFLDRDINIKNEYYLKDYKVENGKTTFYFDYKINDLPISLSNQKKNETDMKSMIELTVEDYTVTKYRRLIYDFILGDEYINLEKSFVDAIDSFLLDNNINNIDEMELSYVFGTDNNLTNINWAINIDNKVYYEDIIYGG